MEELKCILTLVKTSVRSLTASCAMGLSVSNAIMLWTILLRLLQAHASNASWRTVYSVKHCRPAKSVTQVTIFSEETPDFVENVIKH